MVLWCLVHVRDAGAVARGWLYPQVLTTRLEEETKRADDVTSKLDELTTKVSACVRTTRGTLARALTPQDVWCHQTTKQIADLTAKLDKSKKKLKVCSAWARCNQ